MKKLLIGLLVIAAAGGAFFLLKKKKDKPVTAVLNKEWIFGKWQTVSYEPVTDSLQPTFRYDFQKEGIAYRSTSDSLNADTISYTWKDDAQLVIKSTAGDTVSTVLRVSKLTQDSLQVQGSDSVVILLTKIK